MKSRLISFILIGMLLCAATQSFAQSNIAEEAELRSELDTLRIGVDELKVLVSELRAEISTRRKEFADLRRQIQQEQDALAALRRQVAQEEARLAALRKETAQAQNAAASSAPARGTQTAPAQTAPAQTAPARTTPATGTASTPAQTARTTPAPGTASAPAQNAQTGQPNSAQSVPKETTPSAPARGTASAPAQAVSVVNSGNSEPLTRPAPSNTEGKTPLNSIFFAPNSAELDRYYISALNRIGSQMKNNPGMKIMLRGFTTDAGTPAGRDRLSRERAETTGQYLQKNFGITPDRISLEWVGAEMLPNVPNRTMSDRLRRAVQVYTQ